MYNRLKYILKNVAHCAVFIPYRKRNKKRSSWNSKREKKLLKEIDVIYNRDSVSFNKIKVSIVMPVYNRAYSIKKALDSIIAQSHTNWNLIIVDDGSTDELLEVIESFLQDHRTRIIRTERGGVAKARNIGLNNSEGKYVFYLDTDNKWYSDYLRNMIVFMERRNLFAAYSGLEVVDDNKTIGYLGESFNWKDCLELNYIDINSFAHRNDEFVKQFMFDEKLKRLVDWDFILAITAHKATAYAPFLGVEYYDGRGGDRITYTEYQGKELDKIMEQIKSKHIKK